MERKGELGNIRAQLEVQDGLEELSGVDLACAFELLRKQLAFLASEVVLKQVFLESFGEFKGKLQGKALQGEVHLVLFAVFIVYKGLIAHVVKP